ncbi:MAG: flagellar basal body rod protein FlgB [Phycisphaerales bacterium]|nr:flagellar basal body rod protein FlgB [Phycisphaerales bacterium]
MWIDRLTASRTTHAVALAAQYAEQRHKVLSENLANVDTPGFQAKLLDHETFARSLRTALDDARANRRSTLELRGSRQFSTDTQGRLAVQPEVEPAQNVLFHDGTNVKLEQLLADAAQNQMTYELATSLLRGRFTNLLRAIRGRVE